MTVNPCVSLVNSTCASALSTAFQINYVLNRYLSVVFQEVLLRSRSRNMPQKLAQ